MDRREFLRAVGLGAAALNLAEAEHLDRVAFELSLGLHVLSDLRGAFWES